MNLGFYKTISGVENNLLFSYLEGIQQKEKNEHSDELNINVLIDELKDKNQKENTLKAICLIPEEKRTVQIAKLLLDIFKQSNERQQNFCLKILADIPKEERREAIEKSQEFLKDGNSTQNLCLIFRLLNRLPQQTRTLQTIEIMVDLFGNAYFTEYKTNIDQELLTIFNNLLKLSAEDKDIVLKKSKELLKNIPKVSDRISILSMLLQLPINIKSLDDFLDYILIPPSNFGLDILDQLNPDSNSLLGKLCKGYCNSHNPQCMTILFELISERHFSLLRSTKAKDIPMIKQLIEFIDFCSQERCESLPTLLSDLKKNHVIPLSKNTIQSLAKTYERIRDNKNSVLQFQLSLQTHESYQEIEKIFEVKENSFSLIENREAFSALSVDEKEKYLLQGVVFRRRNDLIHAGDIIKQSLKDPYSINERLLSLSLRLCSKVGVAPSKNSIPMLLKILDSGAYYSSEIKVLAAQMLGQIVDSPNDIIILKQLIEILKKTQEEKVQSALVETLGIFDFNQEEVSRDALQLLIKISHNTQNQALNRNLAGTLSVIPSIEALKIAAEIVNRSAWDDNSELLEPMFSTVKSGYQYYNYRPQFLDSRYQMMKIIGERLVELYRSKWEISAQLAFMAFKKDSSAFSPQMNKLKNLILDAPSPSHYIPFQIFLPSKKVLFRGIKEQIGNRLSEAAFNDLLIKGSGNADLSLYEDLNTVWARIGQIFTSCTLNYVLDSYWDKDGILMTIDSDAMNEMQMRRKVRWEKSGSLHSVFFTTIKHYMLLHLFMSKEKQNRVEKLAHGQFYRMEKTHPIRKLQKITQKQLVGNKQLLKKISVFDSTGSIVEKVKNIMQEQGLQEPTDEEIWQENFIRQWIREKLAETLDIPQNLKECLHVLAKAISKIQYL